MTDLVERLRHTAPIVPVCGKAADEIERLRSIRDLLIKSVMRVTGASEESVREAPLTAAVKAADEIERLRAAQFGRPTAIMIARIIEDEIGGEVCTPEWAQAAADRIVCALRNNEQERKP